MLLVFTLWVIHRVFINHRQYLNKFWWLVTFVTLLVTFGLGNTLGNKVLTLDRRLVTHKGKGYRASEWHLNICYLVTLLPKFQKSVARE